MSQIKTNPILDKGVLASQVYKNGTYLSDSDLHCQK